MNDTQNKAGSKAEKQNPVRVTLLASKHTLSEYYIPLQRLLVGLTDRSICSNIVCPPETNIDLITSPGVEIIRYPFYKLPFLGRYNKNLLIEELKNFNPTVLHCLGEDQATIVRLLSKQLNIPYLLTINRLHKRFAQISLSSKRLAQIIAPTESLIADIAKMHRRFSGRLKHINIGTFVPETTECFSKSTQLPNIITLSPLKEDSKFSNLLSAARHLAIEGYEFILTIISNNKTEKHLRGLISALGLTQNVIIVPRIEPWRKLVAAGDIFVQAWPSNSFNLILLEAMSVGTVVAACKGGIDDFIIEGKTAVVFNPDDELSIHNCLQELLNSREKARKIARQAQQYVKQNHSVSKMIDEILQLYNEAVQWYNNA